MKNSIVFVFLLISVSLFSQVPKAFNYQAVIRGAEGQVLQNKPVSLKVSLVKGGIDGETVYSEIHNETTNSFGLISVLIGTGTATQGVFDSIVWADTSYFIKNEIDIFDGNGYILIGASPLVSVPYALYALHAETASNQNDADPDPENEIQSLNEVLAIGNDAGQNRIVNVAEPVDEYDVVNKKYSDSLMSVIDTLELSEVLSMGNDAGQNRIVNIAGPVEEYDAVNKKYSDSLISVIDTLDLSEVLSRGNDAGQNRIVNIANPVNEYDAVNKQYIDALLSRIENLEYLLGQNLIDPRDDQIYDVVKLGDLFWMERNLNYYTSSGSWYYMNDSLASHDYGRLYTWETANNVCPSGWHLPTITDWHELIDTLGGSEVAGGKLKDSGTEYWVSPNLGATDEFGFRALPGGFRDSYQNFLGDDSLGFFLFADPLDTSGYGWFEMYFDKESIEFNRDTSSSMAFSVRCVKDYPGYLPPDTIFSEDLILHLPLNGDAIDESGNNPEGIIHGAVPVEDKNGNLSSAYYFDGTDDYIDVDTLPLWVDHFNSFTISFWSKSGTENTEWGSIFNCINNDALGMDFGIYIHRAGSDYEFGRVSILVRDSSNLVYSIAFNAPEAFNNEWHHFAFNFISLIDNQAEVYIDGEEVEFQEIWEGSPQNFNYFHNPFPIGAGNNRGTIERYFENYLDDFRIYKGALSEQEIIRLFYSQPE